MASFNICSGNSLPSSVNVLNSSAKGSCQLGSSANPVASLHAAGSSSGAIINSLSHSSLQSGMQSSNNNVLYVGLPFEEMVKRTHYAPVVRVSTRYEIKLVHGTTGQLHWRLLVKMKDSDMPFITFEITTSNMYDIIPAMMEIPETSPGCFSAFKSTPTDVGTFQGTLTDLCQMADAVVRAMESYNLLTSNCQHFCNNLLQRLGLRTFPTTIGPETTLDDEIRECDLITRVFGQAMDYATGYAGVGQVGAVVVGTAMGAPQVLCSLRAN